MDLKTMQRMFSHVEYQGGCWVWTGTLTSDGYGYFNHQLAHRAMWELLIGPAPDTLHHECENRACVNVGEHIFPITRGDNVRIGVRNRRQLCQRGHDDWYIVPGTGNRRCRRCNIEGNERRRRSSST